MVLCVSLSTFPLYSTHLSYKLLALAMRFFGFVLDVLLPQPPPSFRRFFSHFTVCANYTNKSTAADLLPAVGCAFCVVQQHRETNAKT